MKLIEFAKQRCVSTLDGKKVGCGRVIPWSEAVSITAQGVPIGYLCQQCASERVGECAAPNRGAEAPSALTLKGTT